MRRVLNFIFIALILLVSIRQSFASELKFVQLSDIHYSKAKNDMDYRLLAKSEPLLKDAITQINALKGIDFVIITGDVVDKPTPDSINEVTDILNTLKRPWFFVTGNHDVDPKGSIDKKNIVKILKKKNRNYNFSSTYYTFVPGKKFRVIVLDGAWNGEIASSGYISKEQLDWLDEILKKSKKDTILIFIHFPPIEPYNLDNHGILNADDLKEILEKYKMPMAVFSGHYHTTKILKRSNIIYVSSPSLINYPNAFRVVDIKNKRRKVQFDFKFLETNLKDVQTKTKILVLGGSKYYGKESDRKQIIVIDKK